MSALASARSAPVATELHYLSVGEASRLIASRAISPVELVQALLDRIDAVDGAIKSYLTVLDDSALDAARQAEAEIGAGRSLGTLHGIPYAVKDNYYTKGVRTTAASRLLLDFVPTEDATALTRMAASGAILLGKLNTWEYGTGTGPVHLDLPFEPARNPWNLDCFTGGSSTGAGASVAAGTAAAALGSDTGGSVRLPAAACGLVGLKPTYGRISRAGILPNCYTLDVPGPLTWTVEDNALLMQAISGYDPRDPASARESVPDFAADLAAGVAGLTIGVLHEFHEKDFPCDAAIAAGVEDVAKVLESLGAKIKTLRLPHRGPVFRDVTRIINSTESLSIHEEDFLERQHLMGQALRDKMMGGLLIRGVDYLRAIRFRRVLAEATDAVIRSCDAVICVGATHVAPPFADQDKVTAFTADSATAVFNVSGHPALTMCNGFDAAGLPLNVQIVGRYFDEPMVLRVAAAYERATAWRARRPSL
jgi:aspartyl-tRNA(Asn)/glutamyl-tRNA(Gln) amidotransferase subunit A